MSETFALQLQLLSDRLDKTLVLADLLERRSEDRKFRTGEVVQAFLELRVPAPSNISRCLADLKSRDLAIVVGTPYWALTPKGRVRVHELVGDLDPSVLESNRDRGAEFAHEEQTVIPTFAAPPRWQVGINRLLQDHPFDQNVFCMTRFGTDKESDPVLEAIEQMRHGFNAYGLHLHVASDRQIDDNVLGNIGAYMWGCKYGIGIIEDRDGRGLNYNAVIEVGSMLITGRRCALLRDKEAPNLPTDLSGEIYKTVDLDDLDTVTTAIDEWVRNDLSIPRLAGS